ncbi:histidine-type phosphatase [Spirochaeta cellobiosiphila]|uniref:histidine-type phosphatase n=1 Tax=Spirochaeta cellobiosiphila TaxID=504483 RepID=UPI0003F9A5E1|nr:histidine-type phosphatase [Spirochaeta cellobiosiphila]
MKTKPIAYVLLMLLLLQSCATNSDHWTSNDSSSPEYLTSKAPYPFKGTEYTPVPRGYEPVFIEYVGRHGSRHLSSAKYDITLLELLNIASEDNEISETGNELRHEIAQLIKIETGNYGELTKQGRLELQGIGLRMYQNFPELLKAKGMIRTEATFKSRAQDSRDNFVKGLKEGGSQIITENVVYGEEEDPYLRPYDIAPRFMEHEEGEGWEDLYKAYEKNPKGTQYTHEVLTQLFSQSFYDRLERGEFQLKDEKGRVKLDNPESAASNLYNLYIISANLRAESDLNFRKYFTDDQLEWYESVLAIEDFYAKGPSLSDSDIQINIIAPLVKDMINSVDNDASYAGVFRFAHAETIIPLAAFLDIKGANISCDDPNQVMALWDIKNISPMAANIQWIIYSNDQDKLVKMTYNEVEINFPEQIKPVSGYYYSWEDVKSYYTQKIEKLGFSMTGELTDDIQILKEQY